MWIPPRVPSLSPTCLLKTREGVSSQGGALTQPLARHARAPLRVSGPRTQWLVHAPGLAPAVQRSGGHRAARARAPPRRERGDGLRNEKKTTAPFKTYRARGMTLIFVQHVRTTTPDTSHHAEIPGRFSQRSCAAIFRRRGTAQAASAYAQPRADAAHGPRWVARSPGSPRQLTDW